MTRWQDLAARITADPHRCRLHGRINTGITSKGVVMISDGLLGLIIGFFLGGLSGVFYLALLMVSKDDDDDDIR